MTTHDLNAILAAAQRVGELQGRLRLLADTVAAGPLREAATDAADLVDKADQRLTRAFVENATTPPPTRPRKRRAA